MVTREMSESNVNVEKDETLNAETAAVENVAETVENKSTEIEEPVAVENQVEEAKTQEPEPKPEQPETQPEVTEEKETLPAEEPKVEEPVAEVKEEPQPETPAEEITEEKPEEKSEEKTEETVEEKLEEPVEEQPAMDFSALGKEQLVEQLEKLMSMPVESVKERVAQIKGAFFALRKEEISKEKAAFVENGNDEEAFVAQEDEIELKIKELLAEFKEKRAEFNAEQEAVKQANLDKTNKIIEEIRTISQDTDNINRQFSHVQQLQQEFKAIGEVPSTSTTEVWKAYQAAIENFYDLLKINKDLRDYDFKKNLEIKQQLCEQ